MTAKFITSPALTAWLILVLGIGLSQGCTWQPPAEAMLDDYLERLARVLRQPEVDLQRQAPQRMPRPRELRVELEAIRINLVEFWGFRDCGLTPILSERNSILGRVMPDSRHLHMDGRILLQLDYCKTELEDPELLALARELAELKRAQWPGRYWNATLAAPEMQSFWSPSRGSLDPQDKISFRTSQTALSYLATLPERLKEDRWPAIDDLEQQYQTLEQQPQGGKLLQSLQISLDYLKAANGLLADAIENASLCPQGRVYRELDYARQVMTGRYVGKLQPWFAQLDRGAQQLFGQYHQLVRQQSPELQTRIQPFVNWMWTLHTSFQQQNREHVAHWQQLFRDCGQEAITS